jgi:hypothetical protein
MGQGITVSSTPNKLTVEIDLTRDRRKSKSGKSEIIDSTEGNQAVDAGPHGIAKLGLNLYVASR